MYDTTLPPRYRAYLLRCWQEVGTHSDQAARRFSIEDPHTGERRGFATWEGLVAFLRADLRDETPIASDVQLEAES